jgi:hypothetical protein
VDRCSSRMALQHKKQRHYANRAARRWATGNINAAGCVVYVHDCEY